MSDAVPLSGPVRMGRFEWEKLVVCCPDSVLADEDKFRLLLLATTMDGKTGVARPGANGLATMAFHEETWKKTLRRMRDAGWLVQLERGGSRKGPGGTRINRTSVDQASVPVEVYARREEILKGTPHQRRESSALPSCEAPSTKEVPPIYEGSPWALPSTAEREATKEVPTSTKEASGAYEGSAQGLPLHGSSSSSTSSLSAPERADLGTAARKSEREDLDEDKPQEHVREVDQFTGRLMTEHAATADEVAAVLAAATQDKIRSLPAWAKSDTGRDDFARRLSELRARAAFAADRLARRSTCGHSDVLDPDPEPGWGNCLLCNIARRRATPAQPPVAAEPEIDGPPSLAELKAGLERARANQRDKVRKTTPAVVREPLAIDPKTIAAREAVAAAEGFRPLVEPGEERASA